MSGELESRKTQVDDKAPETILAYSRCSTPSNESIIFTPQSSPPASPTQPALKIVHSHSARSATATSCDDPTEAASASVEIAPKLSTVQFSTIETSSFHHPDETKQCDHLPQSDQGFNQKHGSKTPIGSVGCDTAAAGQSFHVRLSQQPQLAAIGIKPPRNVNEYISDLRNIANDAEQFAIEYPQQRGYHDIMMIINQEINGIKETVGLGITDDPDIFRGMRKHFSQQLSIQKAATTHYRNDGSDVHIIPGPKIYPYQKSYRNDKPAPFGSVACASPLNSSDRCYAKTESIVQVSPTKKHEMLRHSLDSAGENQATDQDSLPECLDEDFSVSEELVGQKSLSNIDFDMTDVFNRFRNLENEAQRLMKQYPNVQPLFSHILEDITVTVDATLSQISYQKKLAGGMVQGEDSGNLDFQEYDGQRIEKALEEKLARHVKEEDANKFRCCISECMKLFKEECFWRKHVYNRHQDWLAAVRQELSFMDIYALKPENIAISCSDFHVDSALRQGLILQGLLNKEQHFQDRLQAAVESATACSRIGNHKKARRATTLCYPGQDVCTAACNEEETEASHMELSRYSFCSAESKGRLSLDGKADNDVSAKATIGDEILNKRAVEVDHRLNSDEPSSALFADLIPEKRNQYVGMVDNVLCDSRLQTINARAVREAMPLNLGNDLSFQKFAVNELILESFARIPATSASTSVHDTIFKDAELVQESSDEPGLDHFASITETDQIDRPVSLNRGMPESQILQLQNLRMLSEHTNTKSAQELKAIGEIPSQQSTSEANKNTIYEEKALMLPKLSQLQREIEGYEKRAMEMQMEMDTKLTALRLVAEDEQNCLIRAHTNATRASQARLVEADHAFAIMYIEKLDLEKKIEDLRAQFQAHDDSLVHGFESLIETMQSEHAAELAKLKGRIKKLNTRKFEKDLLVERVLNKGSEEE